MTVRFQLNIRITFLPCLGKASSELVYKSAMFRRWLLVYWCWASATTFPASSQPCSLQTGPRSLNWLWPIYPITVLKSVVFVFWQTPWACLKSEVKGTFSQQPRTSVQSRMVFPPIPGLIPIFFVLLSVPKCIVMPPPRLSSWIYYAVLSTLHP